jgi:pimeloyl-ACP methyl ester carboxylesterase
MPGARVDGIDLYFERSGSGPPLIFLNGSGTTLARTGMLVQPFTAAFEVLAFDARGLGRSGMPDGPYTMADCAADAAGLLDHVGWDTCGVVGVSFGGMVAQELAVTWPERVDRLALLCTSPGGIGGASYPLHELDALPANGAYIAAHVPDAEQRLYEGGHAFFVQDPVAFPDVLDFLAG